MNFQDLMLQNCNVIKMLKETYWNKYKGWGEMPPSDAVVICVTREDGHVLSSSYKLLMDYKNERITCPDDAIEFVVEDDRKIVIKKLE